MTSPKKKRRTRKAADKQPTAPTLENVAPLFEPELLAAAHANRSSPTRR
jgi:hypothetical protein